MNHRQSGLTDDEALTLFRWMLLTRRLDQRLLLLQRAGAFPMAVSCRGHEAAQVGAAFAFQPGVDWWFPYYRDLGAVLVAGCTPRELMLSSFGRAADPASGGRQTPYNWGDRQRLIVARSAPVAVQVPQAAGAALAARMRGDKAVVYCSLGEGAASQGDFHEGLNYAALHQVPVVLLCQNNGWAISVPATSQVAGGSVAARARGYGIPGAAVDGGDPFAVLAATREAVQRARDGHGPTLLELFAPRLEAHTCDDNHLVYRSAAELKEAAERDPVDRVRRYLQGEGLLPDAAIATLEAAIAAELDEAETVARTAPPPKPEEALRPVYAAE